MDRGEHMRLAKERALEYLERGDANAAVTSMLSDLDKHEETKGLGQKMGEFGLFLLMQQPPDLRRIREFIEGFAE